MLLDEFLPFSYFLPKQQTSALQGPKKERDLWADEEELHSVKEVPIKIAYHLTTQQLV